MVDSLNKYTQPHLVVAGKWDLFQLTVKMMKWTQRVLEIWVSRSALERAVVRWDEVGPLLKETVEGTSSWMLRREGQHTTHLTRFPSHDTLHEYCMHTCT